MSPSDFSPTDFVVGIGASAGGLQALQEFFSSLPPNPNAVFVVVQHLSPDFRSLMVELLQRRTSLPVSTIEEGETLELNHVYVLPIGFLVSLAGQRLTLEPCSDRTTDYPIDHFFLSLARERGDRTISILLSGTGRDGTEGLKAVSRAGGVALVQSKETAQFDAMPTSPISSGLVDEILSPTDLAQTVCDIIRYASSQDFQGLNTEPVVPIHQLKQILNILEVQEGIDFSRYKPGTLNRRIVHRLLLSHLNKMEPYIKYLRETPEEVKNLRQDLLIGSTRFFRDPEMWAMLQTEILPSLIEILEPEQPLRVWVAACSTGEEAYSMAIAIDEVMEAMNRTNPVKIFATDIDQEALAIASHGTYAESSIRDISPERLEKYFTTQGNYYMPKKSIRAKIIFASHDLTQNPGFSQMHLVSCRNLLIYLQSSLQEQVIKLLHFSLATRGILILGPSETLGSLDYAFHALNQNWKFYQKRPDVQLSLNPVAQPPIVQPVSVPRLSKTTPSQYDRFLASVFKLRFGSLAATCVLINVDYQALHIFLNSAHLLEFALGEINVNILDIVSPSLKLPLSTALHRATRNKEAVIYRNVPVAELEDYRVNLWVGFPESQPAESTDLIVLLELVSVPGDREPKDTGNVAFDPNSDLSQRVRELEYELQQTRANLQTTIEKLETANEEQQATNEEALASNEELQSTNEELQLVNEELYTVNGENQERIRQLTELSADVDNLLRNTNIGVVFLDNELNIRKYTPAAAAVFNFRFADIGRPLSELVNYLDLDDLMSLVQQVEREGNQREVETMNTKTGDRLLLRILPYRREDEEIDGVVLTLITINELKETEQALLLAKENAEKAARAKSIFLANMSHEIRTPINGLRGVLQLLEFSNLSTEQRSHIQIAKSSAEILLNVINDILDYSKIEANKLTIETVDFNIYDKVSECVKSFAYEAEGKGLQLILDLVDVDQPLVKGDPIRIQQIFINLINNAIKFTAEGEIVVRVSLKPAGERLQFTGSVEDTGIGIAPDNLESLFTEFTQVDNSATRQYEGTGLGLAISQKLCELMGGTLTVESKLGQGSCFEFTVYLQPSDQASPPPRVLEQVSVLLVDAHPTHRQVLCRQLQRWGVEVMSAPSVAIAFELCEGRGRPPFDFVLLDEHMPDMGGEEFLQALQGESGYEDMTRIMMTSIHSTGDRSRLEDLGLAQCISKPIAPTELWHMLNLDQRAIAEDSTASTSKSAPNFDLQSFAEEPYILFVEDNEMNQLVLQELAKIFNLAGESAWNGEECLEMLNNSLVTRPFTLVIMDCMMPKMDGYETAQRIRAGDAGDRYRSIPIIAMTANAMIGDEERCLEAGMNDYLMKPIEIDDLLKVLEKWLPKKEVS